MPATETIPREDLGATLKPSGEGRALRRVHLVVGIAFIVCFLTTGQYMDRFLGHLHALPDGQRMLYRSRHIYLLWSALLNLSLGLYLKIPSDGVRRVVASLGSALLLVAPFILLTAFFVEPTLNGLQRSLTVPATYSGFIGVLLHSFARRDRAAAT